MNRRRDSKMLVEFKYYFTAALLGAIWFPVLCVMPHIREILVNRVGLQISLLILTSLILAFLFKRFIFEARRVVEHAVLGVILPFYGCAVYVTLMIAWKFISDPSLNSLFEISTEGFFMYFGALSSALFASYVVIPYGVVCQCILSRVR